MKTGFGVRRDYFFRPFGAMSFPTLDSGLAPWAAFLRRGCRPWQ